MAKKKILEQFFELKQPVDLMGFYDKKGNSIQILIQNSDRNSGSEDTLFMVLEYLMKKMEYDDCRILSILNTIGLLIKHECSYETEMSYIQIVQEYIEIIIEENKK